MSSLLSLSRRLQGLCNSMHSIPLTTQHHPTYLSPGRAIPLTKQPVARFPRIIARAGPSTEDATKEDEQVTFKYNPAMQRWEKKKGGYKDGRKGNVESLITPLAGAAYTVRNSSA